MYTLRADTPNQAKDEIVKWLLQQASNHRIRASSAVLVRTRKEETSIATAYQAAGDFLAGVEIVPLIIN